MSLPPTSLPPTADPTLPADLQSLAADPRVTLRRPGPPLPGGQCVLYWMQHAQRGRDNPALDLAIHLGNALGLPVVVFFSVIPNYPHANLRHYAFLHQGLLDVAADLAQRNVGFVVRRPPHNSLEAFAAEVRAALIVGDENHCREPERWRNVLAHRLRLPFWTVDADLIVPAKLFAKGYYAAHHFRPHIQAELPFHLIAHPQPTPQKTWAPPASLAAYDLSPGQDITQGWRNFDRSVPPVDTFHGGARAASRRLHSFLQNQLAAYPESRRHPELLGTSQLSPWLHFGHISPITIALAVRQAAASGAVPHASADAFLNEHIVWRELAVNFVRHQPHYDSLACAPSWAAESLRAHARDPRHPEYDLPQLERAETYDDLWNAAQLQMTQYGWMHNLLRMYWAKKILEWAPTPAKAFEWAVYLNDKYELDGRDPSGYAGIAWSIAGVFDRPWFPHPIFGQVRYMSAASTGKKFNSRLYKSLIANPTLARTTLYAPCVDPPEPDTPGLYAPDSGSAVRSGME